MKNVTLYLKKKPLVLLLLCIPLAIIGNFANWNSMVVFFLSAFGIVPLAGYIGEATESLAVHTGPKIGGLLNATLGNAAELIITLVAIKEGLLDLVKASITGSIIGNLLLVLGGAMIYGGFKNRTQKFDQKQASNYAVLLTIGILALVVPSFFSHSIGPESSVKVEALSLGVAIVMMVMYILGLIFSLKSKSSPITYPGIPEEHHENTWSVRNAILVLAASTLGVVFMSEVLVGTVEHVTQGLGLSEFFLGIILIPIIGNAAEHVVAVTVAGRNKMDLAVEITVSSSLQIALFVAPFLVFVSLAMGNPLTLIFNPFELVALGSAVIITSMVCNDGESNWLEGAALLGVYIILGLAFFMLPYAG